jgi:hypothetical protein
VRTTLDRLLAASAEGLAPNLARVLAFLGWTEGEVVEIQALDVPADKSAGRWKDRTNWVAHASTLAEATRIATEADRWRAQGVYLVLNRVKPGVQHRLGPGAWHEMQKGQSTTDADIASRRVLYFDMDPERAGGVKGISADAGELAAAVDRAERLVAILANYISAASIGWGLSGNGVALFIALDPVAPEGEVELLVKAALAAAGALVTDASVKVDVSVSDPKRLGPAFGTHKRKGADSAERPHRRSAFLGPDAAPHRLTVDELRALVTGLRGEITTEDGRAVVDAALAGTPQRAAAKPSPAAPQTTAPRGGDDFLRAREIPVCDVLAALGLLDGDQPTCPGCRSADSGVAIVGNGLKCSHDRCMYKGHDRGFRTTIDLVQEVHGLDARGALGWLRERFPSAGIEAPRAPAKVALPATDRAARKVSPIAANDASADDDTSSNSGPVIRVGVDLQDNIDAGTAALAACDDIFVRVATLSQIVMTSDPGHPERDGTPILRDLPKPTLRARLCSTARWVRPDPRGGGDKATRPDDAIVDGILAAGKWAALRPLAGIARTPFLRPDGSVCEVPGYDKTTGFVLVCADSFPAVPAEPSQEDALRAMATILDLFCDFPFVDDASRHVPVAALLTMLAMPALGGANVPAFLIEANTPGTGKGLLLDVVCLLATGREAPKQSWSDDDEMRKVLASAALEGAGVLAFDNISQTLPFGGSAIDLVLTCSGLYKPRILGRSETPTLPWRAVVLGTGNNITIAGDTRRRVLLCRQQTKHERPEQRDDFRYPELRATVRERRGELVAAALTILRAHALAGRPAAGVRRVGSFEEWAGLIASAVAWAGGAVVTDAMPRAETGDDPLLSALGALLESWPRFDPTGRGIPLRTLAGFLYPESPGDELDYVRDALELLAPAKSPGGVRFDVARLGLVLRAHRGRNLGGFAFKEGKKSHGSQTWVVVDPLTDLPRRQAEGGSRGTWGTSTTFAGVSPGAHERARTSARTHAHAGGPQLESEKSPNPPHSPRPPAKVSADTPPAGEPDHEDLFIPFAPLGGVQ